MTRSYVLERISPAGSAPLGNKQRTFGCSCLAADLLLAALCSSSLGELGTPVGVIGGVNVWLH